ncbi:hypothetical protein [Burkholderia territorii]|uniref:hypothetical protein n=1 Tax=Burkholderia territorii TaxID=1503055 RepID=UPI000B28A7F0|nr:hypothetical protein [Burkholderia territorii]
MNATQSYPLAPVVDNISPQLRKEIRQLVDAKYEVDELARHGTAGRRLTTPFHDGADGPRFGTDFFRTILPFSDFEMCGNAFSALVPVSQTIGSSCSWTTRSVAEAKRPALLAWLQDAARATPDDADYMWIKPLGLFLAHEGKNRVGFFRDMNAQWIPARVTPYDYPAADRLAIYEIKHARQTAYWAVLDGQLLEPVNHPDWALPVLRAYGVQQHHQWPHDFPPVDVTAAALTVRLINHASGRPAPLDLELVREKDAYESEEISCSLLDIESLKIPWDFLGVMGGISIGAFVLLGILSNDWPNLRIATGIVAGIGMGGLLAPLFMVCRLPRRFVDPYASLRKFSPRERKAAGIR